MKILEINKFNHNFGGADKHFVDLVQLLKAKGHEVAIFSMQHSENIPSCWDQYFVSYVGYKKKNSNFWQKLKGVGRMFYSWEAKKKINQLLDDFQPEVVHIHNIYHQLCPLILFEIKKRQIPIVMTVHDFKLINPNYNLFHQGKIYERAQNGKYYQCFLDRAIENSYLRSFIFMLEAYWQKLLGTYEKNIDQYIVPSQFVKEKLIQAGVEENKIRILAHFISDDLEKTVIHSKKPEAEKYAIYYGSLSKKKGVDRLIKIFKNIVGLKLYLAGNLESDLSIKENAQVKCLGYLDQPELKDYIKKSLFVVSGSRLAETFGLIAQEAISLGKPFVGFDSGAYGEIIQSGENGVLVKDEKDLAEKICQIRDGVLKFEALKVSQNAYQKYSKEAYYQEIMMVFNSNISR